MIFEGGVSPFFNPLMNFPEGWNLSTTDTALASTLPGVPFSLLWGPVAGYNMAMWITFMLSGLSMYIWVHHLTKSQAAALLAGTIYAFLPYRIAHFQAGHLNLSGTAWFPLYFMGLYEILRTAKHWHWAASITTALSLGMIALSSMYYLYFTLLMTVVFGLSYLILANRKISDGEVVLVARYGDRDIEPTAALSCAQTFSLPFNSGWIGRSQSGICQSVFGQPDRFLRLCLQSLPFGGVEQPPV